MSKENTCCLAKLLKVIDILQKNVTNEDCFSEGCTRPILAPTINSVCYNTRPITLYGRNGNLFTLTYGNNLKSSVFRVEEVGDCCCKMRVLASNVIDNVTAYTATNQYIVINLKCFCSIKCLNDTVVENIC